MAVSPMMSADLNLDAFEQTPWVREMKDRLIHHSDCESQLCIRYTERLTGAGIDTSLGNKGDSSDNAMAA